MLLRTFCLCRMLCVTLRAVPTVCFSLQPEELVDTTWECVARAALRKQLPGVSQVTVDRAPATATEDVRCITTVFCNVVGCAGQQRECFTLSALWPVPLAAVIQSTKGTARTRRNLRTFRVLAYAGTTSGGGR